MLLTGLPAPAQAVLLETFAEAGEKIHHFRSGKSCKAWLAAKVRSRVMKRAGAKTAEIEPKTSENITSAADGLSPQAVALAERFCKIAEPGRSALALLYLNHFSTQEITQILQMTVEELSDAAEAARSQLRGMEAMQQAASGTAEQGVPS